MLRKPASFLVSLAVFSFPFNGRFVKNSSNTSQPASQRDGEIFFPAAGGEISTNSAAKADTGSFLPCEEYGTGNCGSHEAELYYVENDSRNTMKPHESQKPLPSQRQYAQLDSIQAEVPQAVSYKNMSQIPAGCFNMGDNGGDGDEVPVHRVCLDGFWMDKYEVTQADYKRVTGKSPSHHRNCSKCPVENVSWKDANNYCESIGKRLPSEAEWEYAVRAGNSSEYYWDNPMNGDDYVWYFENSEEKTHAVGGKIPNDWGLYDMNGNVGEWVGDWYDKNYYKKSPESNPKGPSNGEYRVVRGGSWNDETIDIRSSVRFRYGPYYRDHDVGFRCVR